MKSIKMLVGLAFAASAFSSSGAHSRPGTCSVALTQDPLVMRLGKDEFRIAFGLDGSSCEDGGCSGSIRYDATWETEGGARSTEQKRVAFEIPSGAPRSLTVDRSYFDTAEAKHTTSVVAVALTQISCEGWDSAGLAKK